MVRALFLAILLLIPGAGASAHHSVLGFDSAHALTLRGMVVEVLWNNPHTYVTVLVTGGAQRGERWVIESESPVALRRLGWTSESVAAGDAIVTTGAPDRRGKRILRCQTVTVDGRPALPCYPEATQ